MSNLEDVDGSWLIVSGNGLSLVCWIILCCPPKSYPERFLKIQHDLAKILLFDKMGKNVME